MQADTVGAELSGDSGSTCSRTAAARVVSSSVMASTASRSAVRASSRVCPTGVNRAMLRRSTARFSAFCRVSMSGTSMSLTSMPSSASSGAEFPEHLVGHPRGVPDLRRTRWWFRAAPSHVCHSNDSGSTDVAPMPPGAPRRELWFSFLAVRWSAR